MIYLFFILYILGTYVTYEDLESSEWPVWEKIMIGSLWPFTAAYGIGERIVSALKNKNNAR